MSKFQEFWRIYPHYRARSKKAIARAKCDQITNGGMTTNARDSEGNSLKLTVVATPDEIIMGAKALRMAESEKKYCPGAQVFLNQSRWEDFDDLEAAAAEYDSFVLFREKRSRA